MKNLKMEFLNSLYLLLVAIEAECSYFICKRKEISHIKLRLNLVKNDHHRIVNVYFIVNPVNSRNTLYTFDYQLCDVCIVDIKFSCYEKHILALLN